MFLIRYSVKHMTMTKETMSKLPIIEKDVSTPYERDGFHDDVEEDDTLRGRWLLASVELQEHFTYVLSQQRRVCMPIRKLHQRYGNSQVMNPLDGDQQLSPKAHSNVDVKYQETLLPNQLFRILPYEMECRYTNKECKTAAEAIEVMQ
ncbi:hypothetical protein CHS0354_006013 [Potamilus streckersoni]|uniref:Uncharacterized protein n=1 Tax=Potamilus streckersoni TaxID=2493646 RepID=A0AAE0RP11_9BIVA|nr:hypothetical protein CHS0354_006013 [Potamilus streckersoni]